MKRLAFLGCVLIMALLFSACGDSTSNTCNSCTNTTNNYSLSITVSLVPGAAEIDGPSAMAATLPASTSSQSVKLTMLKQDTATSAGYQDFAVPGATYSLSTNDPNFACYKNESPHLGHAPQKYAGSYLVAFVQCKKAQTPGTRNSFGVTEPLVLLFSFKVQPCLTFSGGWTLCFPKP